MIRAVLIGIAMLVAVQACTSSSQQTKRAEIPVWLTSPPLDSAEVIYGVGSGYSYDEAKQSALKEISGKLITEISSKSNIEISQYNDSVSRSANEQVSSRTVEMQLSNYKVLKSEQVGNEIFVQLSMSKPAFINSTSSRLKEVDDKIKSAMRNVSKKTKLQQLIVVQELEPSINKARSLVLLLQAAGVKQNTDKYLSYYSGVLEKSKELLHKLRFSVSANGALRGIAEQLVAMLNNENISVSISNKKNADAHIRVDGAINSSILFSQHIAQIKLTFKVSDKNSRVIAVREYELSGASVSNKNNAIESAVKSLGNKFKDNGVLASLGVIDKQVMAD